MGSYFSHVGLALTDFAKRNKILYIAAEPLSDAVVWAKGNRYTFRLRPSTYMQAAMLAEEAAKSPMATTEAPMMPVVAANTVHTTTTARPSPPLRPPSTT